MSRHISDQPREHGTARMREYTRQEREAVPHPTVMALYSRPRDRDGENRKTAEYARIERGQSA